MKEQDKQIKELNGYHQNVHQCVIVNLIATFTFLLILMIFWIMYIVYTRIIAFLVVADGDDDLGG